MAARTYVPTLLSQLRRIERYVERYDQILNDNLTPTSVSLLNSLVSAARQILAEDN